LFGDTHIECQFFIDNLALLNSVLITCEMKPVFAYPTEIPLEGLLENIEAPFLNAFIEKYCLPKVKKMLMTSTRVVPSIHTRLYAIYISCCKTLNISSYPTLYLGNFITGINAITLNVANEDIIFISPEAVDILNDSELSFVLGHELGHVIQDNMAIHTASGFIENIKQNSVFLGAIVSDIFEFNVKRWCRIAEFTADRAGLICCENLTAACSALSKIVVKEIVVTTPELYEQFSDHPRLSSRIKALEKFDYTKYVNN